jgi:transposase-like protein
MKTNVTTIRKHRKYSEEFKRSIVKDFETGRFSVLQLERLHNISSPAIYQWIYKYSTFNDKSIRIIEMKESSTNKLKDLEKKIKELERAVGQKQLYIDYMEKMMEIAKDDLGIDIKKNFATLQSVGSDKTKKK